MKPLVVLPPPDSPVLRVVTPDTLPSAETRSRPRGDSPRARLRTLLRHQGAMAELGRRALDAPDCDRFLEECATLLARTLEVDACAVLETLPADGQLLVRAVGPGGPAGRSTIPDTPDSLAGRTRRLGAPFVVENLPRRRGQALSAEETALGLRVRACLGLVVGGRGGEPFGVLAAYSARPRRFTRDDAVLAGSVADAAAAAVERDRQERALRLGEARYQRIVAHTPGMVYQFRLRPDGAFSFPFVAEGCREMFTVEPCEIYENSLVVIGILHEEDRPTLFPAIMASATTLAPFHWIGRYVRRDGETRWMRADARPERLPDGDVIWDGVMFDISDFKRAEAAALAARDEAERANRAKSEFLSRISHELRTPLNAILGFSQFLQRQAADPAQTDCLGHISRAGTHLLGLINEVLDISSVEAGRLALTTVPVSVGAAVREAFALVEAEAGERGVTLRLERPAQAGRRRVRADPPRLRQILVILLSNAVRYNVNGGAVRVSCTAVPGADQWEIAVADTGPGIPADRLGRLFVAFDRLGAEGSSVPGVGLGLVLCRCLVEALGGTVAVESKPGRGTTFRVRLPAAARE